MAGAIGLRYDAIKDFIRWYSNDEEDLDEIYKEYMREFLHLGSFFVGELSSNRK